MKYCDSYCTAGIHFDILAIALGQNLAFHNKKKNNRTKTVPSVKLQMRMDCTRGRCESIYAMNCLKKKNINVLMNHTRPSLKNVVIFDNGSQGINKTYIHNKSF